MKSQDLSIGNYIVFMEDETIAKVIGIHTNPDGVDVIIGDEETYIELRQFSPIMLTEEVLLKCPEFTRDMFIKSIWRLRNPKNHVGVYYREEERRFVFRGIGMSVVYVDTLHHLQNLVYVNTGKELEVNI